MSASSQESQRSQDLVTPPVPKPRSSIVSSVPLLKSEAESDTETTATTLSDSTVRIKNLQQDAVSKQSFTGSSDTSDKEEGSETDATEKTKVLSSVPATADSVASDTFDEQRNKAESSDSEAEYIAKIGEDTLAFENTAFVPDEEADFSDHHKMTLKEDSVEFSSNNDDKFTPIAATRKSYYERSISLPTEDITDMSANSVRARKRFFEAQIKKEMVVDQLMTQLEEESSPEHKSFLHKTPDIPTSNTEEMVSRQIHSHIFSHELEEQIESLVPENKLISEQKQDIKTIVPTTVKEIVNNFDKVDAKTAVKRTDSVSYEAEVVQVKEHENPEVESMKYSTTEVDSPTSLKGVKDIRSVFEINPQLQKNELVKDISSENYDQTHELENPDILDSHNQFSEEIAEVMKYRSDSISKPSDSMEVHIDKSEIEETEKDMDLDEEIKQLEAGLLEDVKSTYHETDDDKVPEITITHSGKQRPDSYSQGESEDTQSESDITPEDLRDKESVAKLQEWEQEIIIHSIEEKVNQATDTDVFQVSKSPKVHTPEEHIPDTVWEVPIELEPETNEQETVEDIPIDKQPIVEKDEEESQRSLTESCEMKSDIIQSHPDVGLDQNFSIDNELSLTESALELKGPDYVEPYITCKLTEEEAREIAKELVSNIELEISRRTHIIADLDEDTSVPETTQVSDYIKKLTGKEDLEVKLIESVLAKKQREQIIKLSRTDTTTSSLEITDEDLRSSGVETDNSPLESQGSRLCPVEDKSEDDTTEDFLRHEKDLDDDLDKIKDKEVVEKTLAEVKESLEAAQDELIEEQKKKKEVLKKQSPSEFEFKVLALEKYADEYIQECHVEEIGSTVEIKGTVEDQPFSGVLDAKIKEEEELKSETHSYESDKIGYLKEDNKEFITDSKEANFDLKEQSHKECDVEENVTIRSNKTEIKSSQRGSASFSDDEEKSGHLKMSQNVLITADGILSKTVAENKEKESAKSEESFTYDTLKDELVEGKHSITAEYKKEDKKVEKSEESISTKEGTCFVTDDGDFAIETSIERTKMSTVSVIESKEESHSESKVQSTNFNIVPEESQLLLEELPKGDAKEDDGDSIIKVTKKEEIKRTYSEESQKSSQDESIKSITVLDEGVSSSSSSGRKGDSDTMHTLERPDVVMRKHKTASSSGQKRGDRRSGADYEPYSSSGESYYHSFEQNSESIRTPSRPCSSDIDALVGVGTTGSSEYESAVSHEVSGRSFTSHEYHTAVSSLSSRESMKSLDSESSGNLASVEISSEASETLVPSAMELERDMEGIAMSVEDNEGFIKHKPVLEPYEQDIPHHIIKGESPPRIPPLSEIKDYDRSISLDMSSEGGVSEEDAEASSSASKDYELVDGSSRMKRSHEMTFQPEPKKIITDELISESLVQDDKYGSSLDDAASVLSMSSTTDTSAVRTVVERSRTESEKMDGSATSEQLSLTVSGTSEQLSLSSESREEIGGQQSIKQETVATQSISNDKQVDSVLLMTSNVNKDGIQSVQTQVTSQTEIPLTKMDEIVEDSYTCSNGPTQVEYNAEYDDVKEIKRRPGHRRNESTSFKPSAIPVLKKRFDCEIVTKSVVNEFTEDVAESDKYSEKLFLTSKEDRNDEKKDIDEAERIEDESYQTEADQGFHRDMREAKQIMEDMSSLEEELQALEESRPQSQISKSDSESGQRPISSGFSDDRPDSELAELLKQCSSDICQEDPIERPKTPEPSEECEIKDDTPEFSSEAQASVTELEMEYSGAFSRTFEYESHVSPICEKVGLLWENTASDHEEELAEAEAAFQMVPHVSPHSSIVLHPDTIVEDPVAEKHELETREMALKDEIRKHAAKIEATSPGYIPDITITQHMTPLVDRGFHYPDLELEEASAKPSAPQTPASISSRASSETETDQGREYILEDEGIDDYITEEPDIGETSITTEEKTVFESKNDYQERDSATDSPTSDSFEMLEKPDIADDFVIIEEVGKEAHEQDREGKSVRIGKKRVVKNVDSDEDVVISPPAPVTRMTDLKYYPAGGAPFPFDSDSPPTNVDGVQSCEETSQEGSPPSDVEHEYESEVEAGRKWIEMQFQGDQATAVYGYELDYERGPLEDIKEEDATDLENNSSRIGSLGSQVSQSAGSFGSMKESFSSTPDYDVLAGRKFFTRSGDHDDVSMSSLQEFERLENLIAMEINKNKSSGSQDSLNSSSNSKRHTGSGKSGGDDISLASLKEFEGLEHACMEAAKIELKAKEEEALLSEIEEGHESQASESESCETISAGGIKNGDSDEDDYEKRMFEIDEIIRQAQTNVERFIDIKDRDTLTESSVLDKTESMGRGDSIEEVAKIPDLDLDQPLHSLATTSVAAYAGKSAIQQWKDLDDEVRTSSDSLDIKRQPTNLSQFNTLTTSTDSLDIKLTSDKDLMSASTDSIELQVQQQKKRAKDIMTDSIEIIEDKISLLTSTDSLETDPPKPLSDSIDEDDGGQATGVHDQSSSSGRDGDLSLSGKDDSIEHNRMPPPRSELLLGSTDSLEPTSSTATHATYQYETDSVMSSSFTSGCSNTLMSSTETLDTGARAAVWFDDGKPYVTEVIEPDTEGEGFTHTIHRTVEMPPEIHNVTFRGPDAEKALKEYIERFAPGEDMTESQETDEAGNVHTTRIIQRRVIMQPGEFGGSTTRLTEAELDDYLKRFVDEQDQTGGSQSESRCSSSPSHSSEIHQTTPLSRPFHPVQELISTQVKGESAGEEVKKSPILPTTQEGEEALLDLAAELQDKKESGAGSGPSSAK